MNYLVIAHQNFESMKQTMTIKKDLLILMLQVLRTSIIFFDMKKMMICYLARNKIFHR